MNIDNNKRYLSTEDKMEKALFRLLKKRKYNDIFVKDICIEAGINRSSFYSHYADINDFMINIEQKLSQHLVKIFINENVINDKIFVSYFEFIKKYKDFYTAFMQIDNSGIGYEITQIAKFPLKISSQNYSHTDKELSYHMTFFGAGLMGLTKHWLLSGCNETPEQMAKIILDEYKHNAKYF